MSVNTREAIESAKLRREQIFNDYLARFLTLFHNSVRMEQIDCPKRYLIALLLKRGACAYDIETGLFLRFVAEGIDVYGLPKFYTLIGANGLTLRRPADRVVILRANDQMYPFLEYYRLQAEKLTNFDMAVMQNLEAVKTMTIAEVEDQSQLLSLANKLEARQIGATVVVQNKKLVAGSEMRVSSTGAQYLIDKMLQDRQEILNETIATIGGATANTSKRERVQSVEVSASNGFAFDCLNTLIDTFNYDAEQGNMPFRLVANTSLYDIDEVESLDVEEVEK